MTHCCRTIYEMMKRGEARVILNELHNRLYSNETSIILRRDLRERYPPPTPRIAIRLRPLERSDLPAIIRERPRRIPVLFDNIPGGYVAVTQSGELAFMQWLIFGDEWSRFERHFKGEVSEPLKPDECMFEFAYTFEKFRGLGVMGAALVMIAQEAVKLRPSVRWAYNYIRMTNEPSLKGCKKAGFRPYMLREEKWRAMHLRQKFTRLRPGTPFPFENISDRLAFGYR